MSTLQVLYSVRNLSRVSHYTLYVSTFDVAEMVNSGDTVNISNALIVTCAYQKRNVYAFSHEELKENAETHE